MNHLPSHALDLWHSIADDVLAVLLVKPDAWQTPVLDKGMTTDDMPPGPHLWAYRAILELRTDTRYRNARELSESVVSAATGGKVTPQWIAERLALAGDPLREDHYETHVDLLMHMGESFRGLRILDEKREKYVEALAQGIDPLPIRDEVIEDLHLVDHDAIKRGDLGTILDDIDAEMEDEPTVGVHPGIHKINLWLRGLKRQQFNVWAAPYKSRKTSVLATIIVSLAQQGKRCLFMSLDETAKEFTYRLLAVLIAQWFWRNGEWDARDDRPGTNGALLNVIDIDMLESAQKRHHAWHPTQLAALAWAKAELRRLARIILVYDPSAWEGFGYVADVERLIKFANHVYGNDEHGPVFFVAVDHVQKFLDHGADIYKKTLYCTAQCDLIRQRRDVSFWLLSQLNEDAIKRGVSDDQYSVGALGGGHISSNATGVWDSRYKTPDRPDPRWLFVRLKHARKVPAPVWDWIYIHPPSGWIPPIEHEWQAPSVDFGTFSDDHDPATLPGDRNTDLELLDEIDF